MQLLNSGAGFNARKSDSGAQTHHQSIMQRTHTIEEYNGIFL